MTCYLYATKNKKSGDFGKISTELYNKEQIKDLYINSVKEMPKDRQTLMQELELYAVGSIDTKTGIVTPKVEFLLDLGSVAYEQGTSETKA